MRNQSITVKVPLLFSIVIVITALFSVFLLTFVTIQRMEKFGTEILIKFALESSHDMLVRDANSIYARMNVWMKDDRFIDAIFFTDSRYHVISQFNKSDHDFMLNPQMKDEIAYQIKAGRKYFYLDFPNDRQLFIMPVNMMSINLGYLFAITRKPGFMDVIVSADPEVKVTMAVIFLFGMLTIVITSYVVIKSITNPIMEITQFVNKNLHVNPSKLKTIPIKKSQKCWETKKCHDTSCKYYGNEMLNCWDRYVQLSHENKVNPLALPCFDCKVFLKSEGNEITRLKIFLNQLIGSIKHHYEKSRMYSSSLEELIDERTAELRARTNELATETTKTSMILENIVEGTLVTDFSGNLIQMNSVAKSLLGITGDLMGNLTEKTINEVIKNKAVADFITYVIDQTIAQRRGVEREMSFVKKGKMHYYLFKSTLVYDKEKDLEMVVCLVEDITSKRLLDNFKDEFFHTISHDLKNPLTSVVGFLDIVLNGSDSRKVSAKHRKYLQLAMNGSEELQTMLTDLSNVIKLETTKIVLNRTRFSIESFFQNLYDSFYPMLIKKGINMDWKVEPIDLQLVADEMKLKQAFSNLIGNAIKAGDKITLRLEAGRVGSHIVIAIEDTGAGIPEEKIPFIFEKFTQLYTYQDKADGLGLGLSIVKSIINLHNGNITVESQVDQGTKFIITLPEHD